MCMDRSANVLQREDKMGGNDEPYFHLERSSSVWRNKGLFENQKIKGEPFIQQQEKKQT